MSEQKIAEYNRKLDERVAEMLDSKIADLRKKSKLGRAVHIQANTVHDLMADIRFLLSELDKRDEALQSAQQDKEKLNKALMETLHELWLTGSTFKPRIEVVTE